MPDDFDLNEAIDDAMEASGNPDWIFDIEIINAFLAYRICIIIDMALSPGLRRTSRTEFRVIYNPPSEQEKRKLLRLRKRLIKSCLPPTSAQVLLQRLSSES
jgi:hypothetical protein